MNDTVATVTRNVARRAQPADERAKGAELTRERILRAALEEFGAKGFAGARTASIAARAGVNQQLISYHFGGKQGLLDELRRRWSSVESTLVPPNASFEDGFAAYLEATLDNPNWARLVLWQALGDAEATPVDTLVPRLRRAVASVRRRQEAGEITTDLEPEFILFLSYVLTFAPLAVPQFVGGILGVDPLSPEYRHRCVEQLSRVLHPDRQERIQESNR